MCVCVCVVVDVVLFMLFLLLLRVSVLLLARGVCLFLLLVMRGVCFLLLGPQLAVHSLAGWSELQSTTARKHQQQKTTAVQGKSVYTFGAVLPLVRRVCVCVCFINVVVAVGAEGLALPSARKPESIQESIHTISTEQASAIMQQSAAEVPGS